MKKIDHLNTTKSVSFEGLLNGMTDSGQYGHLRLILTKNDNREFVQKYLMVTHTSFGLVKLCDINFNDREIQMDLQNCTNGMVKQLTIDINDKTFNFLLISWYDIRKIVLAENKNILNHNEMLDFNY